MQRIRKIGILLSVVIAIAMIANGCTAYQAKNNSDKVVATYGDQNIYLDEANFDVRNMQYIYEMYYGSYFTDIWTTDLQDGTGKTYEDSTKESIMAQIFQTYVLMDHADDYNVSLTDADKEKVKKAVDSFMADTDAHLLEVSGATEELVTKIYENNALANKVWEAMVADTDTNVSDDEAAQVSISYINIPESDETYTDEEATAKEILKKVQGGTAIADVAKDYDGLEVATDNYSKNPDTAESDSEDATTTTEDTTLATTAAAMKTGDSQTLQVEGSGWYVLYCDSDFDKEATETQKQTIIDQRKSDKFNEVYPGLEKKEFKVDEDIWAEVSLEKTAAYVAPETTAAAESATGDETATAESQSENATAEGTTAANQTESAAPATTAEATTAAQ